MSHESRSKVLGGSYRVTRTARGLEVECLDYHAGPLTITLKDLAGFGLEPTGRTTTGDARPEAAPPPPDRSPDH